MEKKNSDGTITVSLGKTLDVIRKIAEKENRSMSRQIAVIVSEWLETRNRNTPRTA